MRRPLNWAYPAGIVSQVKEHGTWGGGGRARPETAPAAFRANTENQCTAERDVSWANAESNLRKSLGSGQGVAIVKVLRRSIH